MRHDHTDWLIHFVRDRHPEQDLPGESEEEADYYAGGEIEYDASAFIVLKTIIRLGGLIPGYSFRSGRTTIYGGQPAICATEMPIYSFAQYAKSQKHSKNVSAYGVAFLKSDFHAAGGRPAIYGLSVNNITYKKNTDLIRILSDSILPEAEQYRYVAYNPQPDHWIDWSHEREWRWRVTDEEYEYVWCMDGAGSYGTAPGLRLFGGKSNDCHFSKIYVIVWTQEEAEEIQEMLTGFYLANCNNYDTPFSRNVLIKSRIIILNKVISAVVEGKNLECQTIEGIEGACLLDPLVIHSDFDEELEKRVENAIVLAKIAGKAAADNYMASHDINFGYCGFAYASTRDVTNPVVQLMLERELATGPYDGRVLVSLNGDWPFSQSLDFKETIYSAASEVLTKELGVQFYLYSRDD
jgi:hypothetical protein